MLNKKKHFLKKLINILKKNNNKRLIFDSTRKKNISNIEFLTKSIEYCNFLKLKKNIKEGDKIILKLENSIEYLISVFACFLGGFVVCPIDNQTTSIRYKKIKKIIKNKYEINSFSKIKYIKNKNFNFVFNKKKVGLILFTSGSTGDPKGIQFNLHTYLSSAYAFGLLAEYDKETNIYHCLPMHYNAGLLNTFFAGIFFSSEIIIGQQINMINVLSFWNNIVHHNIKSVHIVPEIASALLRTNPSTDIKDKIQKIDKIISTGSYLHEETKNNFEKKFKKRIFSCYGLTEIGGPITLQKWEETFEANSVGTILKDIKIKLIKEKNLDIIYVKTPFLFDSYLNIDGKIEKPILKEGYFNTGDIGKIIKKQLFIHGRKKEILKRGSEIVSLQEIENVCLKNKFIKDCAAVAFDDLQKGSKIFLLIEFKSKKLISKKLQNIKKFLIKNIKKIEYPDKILPVPEILRNVNGKIKKFEMIKMYL